ncbi:MAG: NAD+ synthase [Candidatus Marinarcus sp.]|uniref:NAD+ synthase n=1 Tax=Candidatus Marinarcus sp. TaxID=3100987 RepID=UPI003B0086C2
MNWQSIKEQLITFLKDEVKKTGLTKVTVGLSGGLDSAVVSVLCKEAFGENLKCVLLPSQYSSDGSIEHAKEVCEKFDISYEIVEIAPLVNAYLPNMEHNKLRIGNFSARMRMSVLYDISARDSSLVVGTSNKSELLLGYGTIFGDIACAINPIGELYKSDEFDFARFLEIPESILNKKPSADLWEGQSDEEELGYSYKELDDALKLLVDEKRTKEDLVKFGFNSELIELIDYRIKSNAFKGKLPTIAKIQWS